MKTVTTIALQIVKTLFEAGYTAYFAGGWVRDLLLGYETDEIDIATNASPLIIQQIFPKTIPVGVAFGVVIVVLEGIHFEITTFRKDHAYHDGRHPDAVDFSTPEKDALRRDFTINGMFYDPLTETIHDFVGGQKDLKNRVIRAIGDPALRFLEDRLRMIRAVRFAARFGFHIEEATQQAIKNHAHTLFPSVSMERIWQEFNKMSHALRFGEALELLHRFELLQTIFPALAPLTSTEIKKHTVSFPYFPLNCPTIVFLLELFPNASLEERLALCRYLKTPASNQKLTDFFFKSEQLFKQEIIERVQWAHFYAHPHSDLFLKVQTAKLEPKKRSAFLHQHENQRGDLETAIQRIQTHHPLVNATFLKKEGIVPSKKMGLLLREAERIAINEKLDSPEQVFARLKSTPFWTQ